MIWFKIVMTNYSKDTQYNSSKASVADENFKVVVDKSLLAYKTMFSSKDDISIALFMYLGNPKDLNESGFGSSFIGSSFLIRSIDKLIELII